MKNKELAVLVTTELKGVFFGYTDQNHEGILKTGICTLKNARNCIYWTGIKGFLGLASYGPSSDCRIGPSVSRLTLNKVCSISIVSDDAITLWEKHPWQFKK